MSLYSKLSQSH